MKFRFTLPYCNEAFTRRWTMRFVNRTLKSDGGENYGDVCHVARDVRVDGRLEDGEKLHVIIHEFLHAAFPWMREWMVEVVAAQLASLLWKMGLRFSENES